MQSSGGISRRLVSEDKDIGFKSLSSGYAACVQRVLIVLLISFPNKPCLSMREKYFVVNKMGLSWVMK